MSLKDGQKKDLLDLVAAMNACFDRQQMMPGLVLMYSGIEIVARMGSRRGESTRAYFVRWVDHYVLAKGSFQVTAIDLYAARCGVVHALSPDSGLWREGKARRIAYAWGDADVLKLGASIAATSADLAALHLNDFPRAFMLGIADFMDDLTSDLAAQKRAEEVRSEWFAHLPSANLNDFLQPKGER